MKVSDDVPSLLSRYLPELILASKLLSSLFSEDPSAVGVSNAFIEARSSLESAFVAWTGVVGEFFSGEPKQSASRKQLRTKTFSHTLPEEHLVPANTRVTSLPIHEEPEKMMSSSSPSSSSKSGSNSPSYRHANLNPRRGSLHWLFRPTFSSAPSSVAGDSASSFSFSLRKSFGRSSRGSNSENRRNRPPFRELAILPTQRVTRYVLLYRGSFFTLLMSYFLWTYPKRFQIC